jgi:hypothetical protein
MVCDAGKGKASLKLSVVGCRFSVALRVLREISVVDKEKRF